MSALPLESARLSKLWISFLSHLLGGGLNKNYFDFHIFFSSSITILSYTLILPVSLLQTQNLVTSQMLSYLEYVIQSYFAYFLIKIVEKSSLSDGFQYDLIPIFDSGFLFVPPCIYIFCCLWYHKRNNNKTKQAMVCGCFGRTWSRWKALICRRMAWRR